MTQSPSDVEVVNRVLAGDTEAFGTLVDRYQDEFAAYATHMTGSQDDAADVIQESFVRAYRSLGRCQDPANFKGWLFRIVSNQCKTYLARNARRRMEPLGSLATTAAPDDAGREAAASDLRSVVRRAVGRLPPEQGEALILKYVHEMGVSEIAGLLAVSESALKMRLLRARRALLQELKGAFDDVA